MKGYQSSSVLLRHWFDAFFVVQPQGWICGMMIMMMLMGCGQQEDDPDPSDDDDDYKDVFDTWKYFTTLTDI